MRKRDPYTILLELKDCVKASISDLNWHPESEIHGRYKSALLIIKALEAIL